MFHKNSYSVIHDLIVAGEPFQDHIPVICRTEAATTPPEAWHSFSTSESDFKLLTGPNIYYYNQFIRSIIPFPKFANATYFQYYITSQIQNILKHVCPKVLAPVKPWVDPEVLHLIRYKNSLLKRFYATCHRQNNLV